jgi:hypothetical protein
VALNRARPGLSHRALRVVCRSRRQRAFRGSLGRRWPAHRARPKLRRSAAARSVHAVSAAPRFVALGTALCRRAPRENHGSTPGRRPHPCCSSRVKIRFSL